MDVCQPTTSFMSSDSSLPSEIYLFKQIQSHSSEIDSIKSECKTKSPKLLSQRLPRFMRRRASSHNPKRVPKSVRQLVDIKSKQLVKTSKPQKNRKKYVNKRKHELSVDRRKVKNNRSVLHVWFAKRFQMKSYWNRLIPEKNSTKNERILYQNSKRDFVFYYLSLENCIQIDYQMSDRHRLISCLAKFCHLDIGCTFGAKIYESANREGITVLYDCNSYPFDPLVSSNFLWNQTLGKFWLWVHISVYDKVLQLLTDCLQKEDLNKVNIKGRKGQLERFRLVGPEALQKLSKCFEFDFKANLKQEENGVNSVHYFKFNENTTSLVDSSETNLFEDIPESDQKPKQSNNLDYILIIKNNLFRNRFAIDLIVLSDWAKTLWHKMTENKVHRVGGLHDFRSIALNTSSLLFPDFGFIDAKENEKRVQHLKTLLNIEPEKRIYVIRTESILRSLSKNMSSMSVSSVCNTIEDKSNALINVELDCVNRGVPQESDYICVPTETDIECLFDKTINRLTEESERTGIEDKSNELKREIIGLIEFGKYSLETSRGKGSGVITIAGLLKVVKINEKIGLKYKNNKTFVLFKSLKSSMYRIVTIKVIGFVFSA